jgi:2-iminobutanoate/2-iminopropanoate deaminase
MKRQAINSDTAPKSLGPYSQAVRAGGFVFVSAQAGFEVATGEMSAWNTKAQTRQAFRNVSEVLTAAGSSLESVVKVNAYLVHISDFEDLNEIYGEFFPQNPPALTTIQAARLPRGVLVMVEAVAIVEKA